MSPETIKLLSTIISFFNLGLIAYGAFGMFKWIKNSVSIHQIKEGRYCYGCNSEIISDDEYFRNWATNWVTQGGVNSTNPNPFKPNEGLKLCQKCERDQKLTEITNSWIDKIKIRKFFIENERKLDFTLVGGFIIILISFITLAFMGIKVPIFSLVYDCYLTIYWTYLIFRNKIYLKEK